MLKRLLLLFFLSPALVVIQANKKSIEIKFEQERETLYSLENIDPEATVREVKQKLKKYSFLSVYQQQYTYNNQPLENDKTLSSYQIEEDAVINFSQKSKEKVSQLLSLLEDEDAEFNQFQRLFGELRDEAKKEKEEVNKSDVTQIFQAAIDGNKKDEVFFLLNLKIPGANLEKMLYNEKLEEFLPVLSYIVSVDKKELFESLLNSNQAINRFHKEAVLRYAKKREAKNQEYIKLLTPKKKEVPSSAQFTWSWSYFYALVTCFVVFIGTIALYKISFFTEEEKETEEKK